MRKHFSTLAIIFFSVGMLLSGMQTITGYYADPSGYGFHHIQAGYFYISLSIVLFAGIAMIFLLRRLGRMRII